MGWVRRTASVGLVWLTAAMTVVAGTPHFDCRCPDGHVKPFCLGLASKTTGCCCGRACCSGSAGGKCCCYRTHGTPAGCGGRVRTPRPGGEIRPGAGGPGCANTLAGQELLALSPSEQTASDDLVPQPGLPTSAVLPDTLVNGARGQLSGATRPPAPPADLVTLLGRLLI